MGEHTPTPWCIPMGEKNGFIICSGDDPLKPGPILMVLRTPHGRGSVLTDHDINDNTRFIVTACNSHASLVAENERLRKALIDKRDAERNSIKRSIGTGESR